MRLRWLLIAALEAREARVYYDRQQSGLGTRFAGEVANSINRIINFPYAWPETEPSIRRALVNRFPYLIHYVVNSETITILGVYHARRRPVSWRKRLEEESPGP